MQIYQSKNPRLLGEGFEFVSLPSWSPGLYRFLQLPHLGGAGTPKITQEAGVKVLLGIFYGSCWQYSKEVSLSVS